jgi:predicted O-linked N-acetylglucosamine transferase (SPINDLY family)
MSNQKSLGCHCYFINPIDKNSMKENIKDLFEEGLALHKATQLNEAKNYFERILEHDKNHIRAICFLADILLRHEGKHREALDLINRGISFKKDDPNLFYSQGVLYNLLGQSNKAILSYETSIKLKPNFDDAYLNLGLIYYSQRKFQEAIVQFSKVINLCSDIDLAYFYRGATYFEIKDFNLAIKDFEKVRGNYRNSLGLKAYIKLLNCEWGKYKEEKNSILNGINQKNTITNPYIVFLLTDHPNTQLEAGKLEVETSHPPKNDLYPLKKYKNKKIKIAYFSYDFNNSPISILTLGLFKLHDRKNFEIIGVSLNPAPQDYMQDKISISCDQFINVSHMSDLEIAKLSRDLKIDIAIDLNGHVTSGARLGIFSYRVAPIQINFLGTPGTIGSKYHDFIIADKVVVPETHKKYYSEKIIYLPHSYFINSHSTHIFRKNEHSLKELKLPSNDFIFCCFNNTCKITPEIFNSWMRILKCVPQSVLWLIKNSDEAENNLKRIAKQYDVDPHRIIFTRRSNQSDYYGWYQHADLFLDTFPYGAHTTALDSLWFNVPVITKPGDAFSSRVCASQLTTLNLPELICKTLEDYENKAIDIASDEKKLTQIKNKLEENVSNNDLFNTINFTKNLENAYREVYNQYQNEINFKDVEILF